MAKTLAAQIAELERAVESRAAPEQVVTVDLVTAVDRAEALALLALPATLAPDASRVRLIPQYHTAAEHLGTLPTLPERDETEIQGRD